MPHSNISIFVPHVGCPHMCAFCNQRTITGTDKIPHGEDVVRICERALSEVRDPSETQIAFFGGSFTAIPRDYMLELLGAAQRFLGDGGFSGIRISTRPDYIDNDILDILREYGVTSVELGAQSMSDPVLEANGRGHTSFDVEKAAGLIKDGGFELGLQMMVGLYKSTPRDEIETFEKLCALSPDTLRIYPVVILDGTELGRLFKKGEYKPFDFDTAVGLCSQFLNMCEKRGIKVIKLGLHASEFVEEQALGGFYHPAFRELCDGRIYREEIERALPEGTVCAEISVPARNISKALGQKKCNLNYFNDKGITLKILPDSGQTEKFKVIGIR